MHNWSKFDLPDPCTMKNKFLPAFIAFAFLLTLTAQAQNWVYPGSQWKYNYNNASASATGYMQIQYIGDTQIIYRNCQVLYRESYSYSWQFFMYGNIPAGNLITFDSANVVYNYNGTGFDTLYNYNAVPGDRWEMTGGAMNNLCDPHSQVVVLDTGTKIINAMPLHYLYVQLDYGSQLPGPFYDTIVERVGAIVHYMLPYDLADQLIGYGEGGDFRCYSDNFFPSYKPHYANPCDFVITTNSIPEQAALAIRAFPNPAHDQTHVIGIPEGQNAHFRIFSADGRLVLEGELANEAIPVAQLQDGYYLLEIQTENQQARTALLKY